MNIDDLLPLIKPEVAPAFTAELQLEYVGRWEEVNDRIEKWFIKDNKGVFATVFRVNEGEDLIVLGGKKKFGNVQFVNNERARIKESQN